jgi:hypothetical protein
MKADLSRWSFDPTKHYHGVLQQQGRVALDADWNEQGAIVAHRVESEALDIIGPAGAPAGDAGFHLSPASNGTNLTISAGRAYVDGILCENEQAVLITAQPDLPGFQLPTAPGAYIAYLEAWLRNIIYLDDQSILEAALGGPDTCSRAKTIWQVKLLAVANATSAGVPAPVTCSNDVPVWETLIAASTGTLKAQAQPNPANTDPCMVPANAGYRSLENQLYRVEIHDGGDISGKVTFKWSRDNGSVVTSWLGQTGNSLTVSSTGRDAVLGFAPGQWVELTDDTHDLNFQPGTLVQISNVQGLTLTINPSTATGPTAIAGFPKNPKIRRWDSAGLIGANTAGWINLEDGVQVEFGAGTYSTGDYWMIPARTLTANVAWPLDSGGNPVAQPGKGIRRYYARLAILQYDGKAWSVTASCLPIFYPITTSAPVGGIHVVDVRTLRPDAELVNDSDLSLASAFDGGLVIRFLCDAPIDPVSAKPATCFVNVYLPYSSTQGLPLGSQAITLPATVSISSSNPNEIDIGLLAGNLRALYDQIESGLTDRLLTRVTLKGGFIWAQNNPQLYLDGEAFGVTRQDPTGNRISLRLPKSGNGVPGSDFEMWFWFTRPVGLASLTFSPNPVNAGATSTGIVALNGYAPPGGSAITLQAGSTAGTISPTSLTIPEGSYQAQFSITNASVPAGAGSASLQVTATYGTSTVAGTLTINQQIALKGLAFSPNSVLGGQPSTGTVTLTAPAPAGGAVVTLTPVDATVGSAPTSVTVAAGQSTQTFQVTTVARTANTNAVTVQMTASYSASTAQATLTVTAPRLT